MAKNTDIRPTDANVYFLPVEMRVPLKFGPETVTSVTCARIRKHILVVSVNFRLRIILSGQPLRAFLRTTAHRRKIQMRVVLYRFRMFIGHLTGSADSNTQAFFIMTHSIFSGV